MHAVITDFQSAEPGTLLFTYFHVYQILPGITAEGTQLIQFGIVTFGNDAAFANDHRRIVQQCALQQFGKLRIFTDGRLQIGQSRCALIRDQRQQTLLQLWQHRQRIAQTGHVPWSGSSECHSGKNPFNVTGLFQKWLQHFKTIVSQ